MVNIRLDLNLWHQAKVEAVRQRKTMQYFVEEALKEHIKRQGKKEDTEL